MGPLVVHSTPQPDAWETCRGAVRDWFGLQVEEDQGTTAQWCAVLEGLPMNLDPLRPLVAFAAMLKASDPKHDSGLVAELALLEPFEAVSLFRNSEAMEVGFGFLIGDDEAPAIYGFDFDKPVHYERLSREPEFFSAAETVEAFALGILIDGLAPDHALLAMAEHDDLDEILEQLTAAFGRAQQFDGIWLFGDEQILVAVRWFPAISGYRLDLVALSERACRPLVPELLRSLNFPAALVTAHNWSASST